MLPDGRAVLLGAPAGHRRLMVVEVGKDPAPLVNTAEETSTLLVASLSGEIPFLIGADPRRTIAFASISNGRITRRFPFDKGAVNSLAFAPDAKTFYCAARGSIWSIPLAGGSPTQIRSGDSFAMDPAGQYLLIQVNETPKARLLRVLLNGGTEQETPLNGLFHMTFDPIHSESIAPAGRLFVPLASLDSWFFPPPKPARLRDSGAQIEHRGTKLSFIVTRITPSGQSASRTTLVNSRPVRGLRKNLRHPPSVPNLPW